MHKLHTAPAILDALNQSIDTAKRRTPAIKVDKDVLFALITDHRNMAGWLAQHGADTE